jgi:hypothetical protein
LFWKKSLVDQHFSASTKKLWFQFKLLSFADLQISKKQPQTFFCESARSQFRRAVKLKIKNDLSRRPKAPSNEQYECVSERGVTGVLAWRDPFPKTGQTRWDMT